MVLGQLNYPLGYFSFFHYDVMGKSNMEEDQLADTNQQPIASCLGPSFMEVGKPKVIEIAHWWALLSIFLS